LPASRAASARAGSVLTDTEAVSLRTLGWIAAMAGTKRWFLWETTGWYDGHEGAAGRSIRS